MVKVVLIGAGNLATQLGVTMSRNCLEVAMVYSRTSAAADELALRIGCNATTTLADIPRDADLYIFAVKDAALEELLPLMPPTTGIWVHTAGSVPISLFAPYTDRYGVFYPLQTFSKSRDVNFSTIPIYIEAATAQDTQWLRWVADMLTDTVLEATSEQRKKIHLAAVFANNFVNHCYHIAAEIVEAHGIDFAGLLPLIDETAAKIHHLHPRDAQTGPAVRYDSNVMAAHETQLNDAQVREIYHILSKSIHQLNGSR